jgi:phosphinothricin acetyltransferase
MHITIRRAVEADLPAMTEIYNDAVIHTTATLDLEPRSVEDRRPWFEQHNKGNHPLIVAVAEEGEGQVVGYASLSDLFDKDAYISTVELSIYVHPDYKRQGIGDCLMKEILDMAKKDPVTHSVVSKITAGNAASDHLHEKYGFAKVGTLHECASKFGRLLDMNMYETFV